MMAQSLRIFLLILLTILPASAQNDPEGLLKEYLEEGGEGELLRKLMESMGKEDSSEMMEKLHQSRKSLSENAKLYDRTDHKREDGDVMDSFESLTDGLRKSVVKILTEGEWVAMGTVIAKEGYVLTKASELTDMRVTAEFENGDRVMGRVLDRYKVYDLALIKLDKDGLTPVAFSTTDDLTAGTILIAPGLEKEPLAMGVLSVTPRNLSHKGKGFLGIGIEPADGGVLVTGVLDDGGAARAGLRRGDVIISIDEQPIHSVQQLIKVISSRTPEETVILKYKRNGKDRKVEADLGERAPDRRRELMDRFDYTNRMGGEISENHTGYPHAIQHDLTLKPDECGGPLVDLEGNVVGINIARAGRTRSYAIPASEMKKMLTPKGAGMRLFAKPREVLVSDLKETKEAVERAKSDLEAAEMRKKALEKMLKGTNQTP